MENKSPEAAYAVEIREKLQELNMLIRAAYLNANVETEIDILTVNDVLGVYPKLQAKLRRII